MKATFIEGPNDTIAVQFAPETSDELLLAKVWNQQMQPQNLLRVQGWKYSELQRTYGPVELRAYIVPHREQFEPHRNERDLETLQRCAQTEGRVIKQKLLEQGRRSGDSPGFVHIDTADAAAYGYEKGYLEAMRARDRIDGKANADENASASADPTQGDTSAPTG